MNDYYAAFSWACRTALLVFGAILLVQAVVVIAGGPCILTGSIACTFKQFN